MEGHTKQHVRLFSLSRGCKGRDKEHKSLEGVHGWFVCVDFQSRLGGVLFAEFHGGLVATRMRRIPGSYSVDGVHQVARYLVQLEALPQGGFIENVERFVVEAGKVNVEQRIGVGIRGRLAALG